jgi:hypothetical protein
VAAVRSPMEFGGVAAVRSPLNLGGVAAVRSPMEFGGVAAVRSPLNLGGVAAVRFPMGFGAVAAVRTPVRSRCRASRRQRRGAKQRDCEHGDNQPAIQLRHADVPPCLSPDVLRLGRRLCWIPTRRRP